MYLRTIQTIPVSTCADDGDCHYKGTCSSVGCLCNHGWESSYDCSVFYCKDNNDCYNKGICNNGTCECQAGWDNQSDCSEFACIEDFHCKNNGTCETTYNNCYCEKDWREFLDCTYNCPYLNLIGNGFCNDETNNANCNYDGGDCCISIKKDHCSDCVCYYEENCDAGLLPSFVRNGFCNDETNNAACNYDGGDCCGFCIVRQYCSECECLHDMVIWVVKFPREGYKIRYIFCPQSTYLKKIVVFYQ